MRNIFVIFLIILFCILIYIGIPKGHALESINTSLNISRPPFEKGESFTYEVRYKKLRTGESILTFNGEDKLGKKEVYHITFFTKLVALEDTEELYADKDSFLPLYVHRTIKRFGTFTTRIEERYDQENFRVDIKKKTKFRSKEFSIEKDSELHNAILLTYYYRKKESFDKNEKFKIILPTAEFEVSFEGIETIETPLGKYPAYLFSSSPSKFKFWLSTDDKRIPLRIENPSKLGYSLVIKSID